MITEPDMPYAARGVQSALVVTMPCVARDLQSVWVFCRALLPGDHLVIAPQKCGLHFQLGNRVPHP